MGDAIMTLIVVVLMLFAACFIGSLILAKDTREFHISFGWKGFDISGSFFSNNNPQENHE